MPYGYTRSNKSVTGSCGNRLESFCKYGRVFKGNGIRPVAPTVGALSLLEVSAIMAVANIASFLADASVEVYSNSLLPVVGSVTMSTVVLRHSSSTTRS